MSPRTLIAVTSFVAAATALCLAVASPALLGAVPIEYVGVIVPLAQLTPFITAVIFWAVLRRESFVESFALRWRRSWPGIGIALAVIVIIGSAQLALGLVFGYQVNEPQVIGMAIVAVPVLFVLQSVFAVGEEFGWRGWLVTQLRNRSFVTISIVSAVAWVIWHLPALPLIVGDGGWQPGAAYLLAIASWAPFMVALRLYSGSVWPAVFAHGALNSIRVFLTQSIAQSNPQQGDGINWIIEGVGCALWLAVAWWLFRRARARATER